MTARRVAHRSLEEPTATSASSAPCCSANTSAGCGTASSNHSLCLAIRIPPREVHAVSVVGTADKTPGDRTSKRRSPRLVIVSISVALVLAMGIVGAFAYADRASAPPPRTLMFELVVGTAVPDPWTMAIVEMTQVAPRTVKVRVEMLDTLERDLHPRVKIFRRDCSWLGLNPDDLGPVVYHVGRLTGRVTTLRMRGFTLSQIAKPQRSIAYIDDYTGGVSGVACADLW